MEIQNMFPIPLAFFDLDRNFKKSELSFLMNQETRPNTGNTTSKDFLILQNSKVKQLNIFVQSCVDKYFQEIYCPLHDVKLRITQSWLNYTKPGEYHHKHEHPNSLVSGVFYIDANEELDKIVFFKNKYEQIDIRPKNWNMYNSKTWWFSVKTGKLILFPSSFTHCVESKQGDNLRVSLSFNTFPVGQIGENLDMTGLYL